MKAIEFNFSNTLKIVLAYAALVYILAIVFTSCNVIERPIRESNHRSEAKFRRHADGCNGRISGYVNWRKASLNH